MKKNIIGRCSAFILAMILAFTSMPLSVYAEDGQEISVENQSEDTETTESTGDEIIDVDDTDISQEETNDSVSNNVLDEIDAVSDNDIDIYDDTTEEQYQLINEEYTVVYEYEGAASIASRFMVPYVSTYYFNPKPSINDNIQIPLYLTDYEQSEYLNNNASKKVDLIYKVDGVSKTIKGIPLGDYTLTIGKLSEGMHYFSVQVVDTSTGMKSHELFNELWVIDPTKEKITDAQTYKMTASDLKTYGINNQNSTNAADCINTRDGLNKLFADKQAAGYRKIVLLPGTYRINGERTDTAYDSTQIHYILIPTHFTVDMNGSTFKLDTIKTENHGCIVEMIDAVDSHITNGTLEGDRFERKALGLESDEANKDCKGEPINTLLIKGGKYCSANNLVVKNTTGHAVGSGGEFGPDYTFISEVTPTAIFDGVEVASSECSTSSMIDLTKIMAWDGFDGYIFVAHLLGYKGIQGESPIEYISFYDENKNYLETVVGYQYRKIKIPAGAKYLRATFLGQIETTGYEHTVTVYTQHLGDYTSYQNLDFYDTRTTALVASCGTNILIEGCTYTRCGASITPVAVDFEEGGEECQDLYYRNNTVIENTETTTGTVVDCAGYNHIYENNIGHNIELRTRVMGGVLRNTNDESSVFKCFLGTDKTGKFGRVYDNNCGYIQFSNARLSAENRSKAVNMKVKNCTIHCGWYSEGIEAVADKVTYENCIIPNFFGSNATLRNCTLQPTLELGTELYFYDCTFKVMDGTSNEVGLNLPYIGNKVFDNCTFQGKTTLHSNGFNIGFGLGTYKNCSFDELQIYLRAEDKIAPTIFDNCTIKSASNEFIYVGAFTKDINHIDIQFNNCDITQTGDSDFIFFYAKPSGDSQILFDGCTINKNAGNLVRWENDYNLTSFMDKISVDVIFSNTSVDRTLSIDRTVASDKARIQFTDEMGVKVKGHSISLNGQIAVNYYIEMPDSIRNSAALVHFYIPGGGSYDVNVSDGVKADGFANTYIYSCSIPASYMTANISAQIIVPASGSNAEKTSTLFRYSVKEYADYILAHSGDYKSSEVELVKAMLNYGAYAQQYFGINTNNLANKNIYNSTNDPVLGFNQNLVGQQITNVATKGDLEFYGASLVCKGETSLKLYFGNKTGAALSSGRYTVKATSGGKSRTVSGVVSNNMYVVTLTGIAAAELDNSYQFTITDTKSSSNNFTFNYSPVNYMAKAQKSSDTALVYLTRAIYYYNQAAHKVF